MSEKVRVLRILEYVGERKWVENTLATSSVPLNGTSPNWGDKSGFIKSGMIGNFPEVVQHQVHPMMEVLNMLQHKIDGADNHYEQDIYSGILKFIEDLK